MGSLSNLQADRGPAPILSVVLPVLNEELDIGRVLDQLLRQVEPTGGYEVLVADGGSTDRTPDIVRSVAAGNPRVVLVVNSGRLSSAGRNAGARASRGQYILFLDGHCSIPRDDYMVRAMELFDSTGADCLCRPQYLDSLAEGGWAKAIAAARHSWLGHNYRSDIYGGEPGFTDPRSAGAAYRRECLDRLGGYDERFDACEDVEFNHRVAEAGYKAYRHPDLRIDYRPRRSLRGLFRQMYRYGRGRARLMARHRDLVPWPLVFSTSILLLVPLVVVAGWRVTVVGLGSVICIWLSIIMVESLRISRLSILQAGRAMLAFFMIHGGLLVGFWRGLVEAKRYRRPSVDPWVDSFHDSRMGHGQMVDSGPPGKRSNR